MSSSNNSVFTKPIENGDIAKKLEVRLKGGARTSRVSDFLDDHNPNEMNFYKDAEDAIWGHQNFNPRNAYKFRNLFAYNQCYQDLCELLDTDENGQLKLLQRKLTFQLGKKGSGKTITQNVWLGDKNKKLEDNNIFWIRLDVEKLYNLRESMSKKFEREMKAKGRKEVLISTKEYFLGQLLYVFCKRFKEFPYQDPHDPEVDKRNKCTSSELIKRIYKDLSESGENNINKIKLTKKEEEHYEDLQMFFQSRLSKLREQDCTKITDYLSYLEEIISKDERTWKRDGEERTPFAPTRKTSYLIDHVFLENKDSALFKSWKFLGETLRGFILNCGYRILYIVDGVDNINFENPSSKDKYEELIEELLDFPVSPDSDGTGNDNELIFIAMRDSTFVEFEKRYKTQPKHRNLQSYLKVRSRKIFMDDSIQKGTIKEILEKRAKFIKESKYAKETTKMAKILDRILTKSHNVEEVNLKKIWNSNYRSFLYSRLYLSKYLAFRYYWRTNKEIPYTDEEIDEDINIFEDINFYLNGEMYAQGMENDDGTVRFNHFGFIDTLEQKPFLFIYIYILEAIKILDKNNLYSSNIINIMEQLGFFKDDCESCINNLEKSGMLKQLFNVEKKEFAYDVTEKGTFFSEKFCSCIQYLYHSCIDTKLPNIVFDSIKRYISPNDVPPRGDRNFPVNCIIVGVSFLNFLKFEHKRILKDKRIWKNTSEIHSEEHIDMKTFELPINDKLLKESIRKMLKKVIKNSNQIEILEDWLNKTR
ncbi:MAG: hypothetical protein LBU83_12225 [Bacteroidales bacterium]|nr:hypothetical protein [Bacteroidales bacterium]